ncbi:hypothetical protein COT48_00200 [Candidatus Woesearchaeota archaeon CG08_land_8_20_14_0_20_47_9]|nr:MAG: hypothetical protein AUJ69_03035 [Candidatus Woesearchaeota archaeon CG1_02_47_18]PIN72936.1 MAG: hypothetical protein COV22_01870 [Candidatus Woesearchaeota archaeon CG10_big_fil_rev_8_21_14_0_10_47_5]PIO04487.1 MAG: hypothetical protein COT48_00200 [Candidatus Woesearchaeota archaeon CG08_land_8_20_14_0_20_47_9]
MTRLSAKQVEEVIAQTAGDDVIPLVKTLRARRNVSEFKLADSMHCEVNRVRNMLYRLYRSDLVSCIRKKSKSKGWYVYYWTFKNDRLRHLFKEVKQRRLDSLREMVKREKDTNFFICPNKCMRIDFEQAVNFEFKCPECGELMTQLDNSECVRKLENEIKYLESPVKTRRKGSL